MTKPFDYLMLAVDIGVSRKYRRMSVQERWATVAGVFSLAAKSPVSGALLITYGVEVTAEDVAEQAGVSQRVANSTLTQLKVLGELVRNDELGAWQLEDWTSHQPAPRRRKPSDSAESTRERKRRSRAVTPSHARDGHAVTTPEEKRREVEHPQTPVTGGTGADAPASIDQARRRLQDERVERVWQAYVDTRVSVFGPRSQPRLTAERRALIAKRLKEWPEDELIAAVRGWRHVPHNRGENERRQPFCELELILRVNQTTNNVERFRDIEQNQSQAGEQVRRKLADGPQQSDALRLALEAEQHAGGLA